MQQNKFWNIPGVFSGCSAKKSGPDEKHPAAELGRSSGWLNLKLALLVALWTTVLPYTSAAAGLHGRPPAVSAFVEQASSRYQHGQIQVSSNMLAFGNVAVGKSVTANVALRWTGHNATTVTTNALRGVGFSLTGTTFPLILQPQVAVNVAVRWSPTVTGAQADQLSFSSQSTGRSSSVINLSGTGVAAATTRLLLVSPTSLNFGSVPAGTTGTQTVTLKSTGTSAVNVLGAKISGASFKLVGTTLPHQLAPTQSFTLQVQFAPTAIGAATGQLLLTTDATNGTTTTLALGGTGTSSPVAALTASASALNFGTVALKTPVVKTLTLTSTGIGSVTVKLATISGTGYSLIAATLPVTLASKQTVTLRVQFDPTTAGSAAGKLTILSNSATNSSMVVALSGSGSAVSHTVQLEWTPPTSSSDPVTGYNIYRSTGGQAFQKLNASLLLQSSYIDSSVTNATSYIYEVKSVDAQAVEGAASNSANISVP